MSLCFSEFVENSRREYRCGKCKKMFLLSVFLLASCLVVSCISRPGDQQDKADFELKLVHVVSSCDKCVIVQEFKIVL